MEKELEELVVSILSKNHSMVEKCGFDSIYYQREKVKALDGDIVECGVFRGGMALFMTKIFKDKKIWVVDSFEKGFQDPDEAKYPGKILRGGIVEPHVHNYPIREGLCGISLEEVKNLFEQYGEGENTNVNYLDGYVRDTLKPENCPIEKIALLRIDVDSYSATLEVLDYLYPKVTTGGMIIFDDTPIDSARFAIQDYFKKYNLELNTYNPHNNELGYELYGGSCCYLFKK